MSYSYRLEYATRSKIIQPKSVGKIVVAKEDGEAFFREKMSGSVTVTLEDYNFIRDAEIYAVECCQEITFIVERSCVSGREIFWEGYFSLYDVEWDLDNQEAVIKKITVRDKYNVVFANWHKEINWFGDIPIRRPAAAYVPNHPLQPFTHTAPTSNEFNPSGSNSFGRGFYFNYAILWLVKETLKETASEPYSEITEQQMSEFLTAETNPVNGKPNYLRDVLLMHISDAKRPGSSEPAWIGKVTLRDVLEGLKQLYNAYWFIDEDDHFRIEHISYFKNFSYTLPGITLDLTEARFAERMKYKNKYSYQADLLKGREGVEQSLTLSAFSQQSQLWTNFANPSNPEFSAAYMWFGESCVPRNDKGETGEEYKSVSLFTTDWRTVIYKPDIVSDQGWVLVHVPILNAPDAVAYGWCPILNEYWTNGNMSMTRLFYEFGRNDLSFQYGMMSFQKQAQKKGINQGSDYVTERPMKAKSTKRVKLFDSVELDMCCGNEYDFSGFIKHPLDDNCVVDRMEYDLSTETVTITPVSSTSCDNIPFPEYEEIEEPNPECPSQGTIIRSEMTDSYTAHTAINYVYITIYTDYYADGNCGEYSATREVRQVTPKRQNGPR